MSEKPLPFVVNDRRKFTAEGELRPDAEIAPSAPRLVPVEVATPAPVAAEPQPSHTVTAFPTPVSQIAEAPSSVYDMPEDNPVEIAAADTNLADEPQMPPAPTDEQMQQARLAYTATADRIETAIRATNPGMEHPPAMSFETVVQSVYMQAILQLGGGTQEGQQPQVDILGARQSIDMLSILADKTAGNLSGPEQRMIDSAVFELQLAFLEITQALARSAQQRAVQQHGASGAPAGGPRIVR